MSVDKELYPLTPGQDGLILSQLYSIEPLEVRAASLIGAYFIVPENCDLNALEKAFNRVIEQNDALRLRIVRKGLGFYQYIADYEPRKLTVVRMDDSQEAIDTYIASVYQQKIRLFDNDLVWAQMGQFGTGGILLMRFHHMCADGYSLGLIFKALEKYYDCFAEDTDLPQEKTYSVVKYFEDERKYQNSPRFEKDKAFWKESFNTQRDYKFPAGHRSAFSKSDTQKIVISGELYQKLHAFCHENSCSTQAVVTSLIAILIYIETEARNFAICNTSHNRSTPALRQTVGCMVNSCVTFFDIDTGMSINEFARDSYMRILKHLSHGRTPVTVQDRYIFKESVKHGFNFSHQWLIVSNMDLAQSADDSKYTVGVLPMSNLVHQLYCALLETQGKSLGISLTYQVRKFNKAQIDNLLSKLCHLMTVALDYPESSIEDISYSLKKEKA